jgi:hypothetical protein
LISRKVAGLGVVKDQRRKESRWELGLLLSVLPTLPGEAQLFCEREKERERELSQRVSLGVKQQVNPVKLKWLRWPGKRDAVRGQLYHFKSLITGHLFWFLLPLPG